MTVCVLAWAVALLMLPVLILLWMTESRSSRLQRLKKSHTWKQLGQRYGVSPTTARRWALAG